MLQHLQSTSSGLWECTVTLHQWILCPRSAKWDLLEYTVIYTVMHTAVSSVLYTSLHQWILCPRSADSDKTRVGWLKRLQYVLRHTHKFTPVNTAAAFIPIRPFGAYCNTYCSPFSQPTEALVLVNCCRFFGRPNQDLSEYTKVYCKYNEYCGLTGQPNQVSGSTQKVYTRECCSIFCPMNQSFVEYTKIYRNEYFRINHTYGCTKKVYT